MAEGLDLIQDNQRRILTKDTSLPRILIGGMNNSHFPNFQTTKLLELATVLSITTNQFEALRPDRIYVPPGSSLNLQGFKPDFFWDSTILGKHRIVRGLDKVSFPTLVGWVHSFKGKGVDLDLCFDRVIVPHSAISHRFGANWQYEPFSLSFGSFEDRVPYEQTPKDIDVCVCMKAVPYWKDRTALVRKAEELAEKRPEWNFFFGYGMDYQKYCSTLARSRIVLQAGNWGLQTTYRVLEAMETESWIISIDEEDEYGTTLGEVIPRRFYDHIDSAEELERVIEERLQDPELQTKAQGGKGWLRETFSYEAQMRRLIDVGMGAKHRRKTPQWGLYIASMIYDGTKDGFSLSMMDHAGSVVGDQNVERRNLNLQMLAPYAKQMGIQVPEAKTPLELWAKYKVGGGDPLPAVNALNSKFPEIPEPNLIHMEWGDPVLSMDFIMGLAWAGKENRQDVYEKCIWRSLGL